MHRTHLTAIRIVLRILVQNQREYLKHASGIEHQQRTTADMLDRLDKADKEIDSKLHEGV